MQASVTFDASRHPSLRSRYLLGAPSDGRSGSRPSHAPCGAVAGLVKTLRPHQWVKNLFVLAPMFFHKDVFVAEARRTRRSTSSSRGARSPPRASSACSPAPSTQSTISSTSRPTASTPSSATAPSRAARCRERLARAMAAGTRRGLARHGVPAVAPRWRSSPLVYFAENLAYSFKLKKVAFLDVGLIAFGFVLRVLAGGIATDVHVSAYMLACTALLALFLGFGKRRHELALENAGKQRASLEAYSARSLNVALAVTGHGDGGHVRRLHARPGRRAHSSTRTTCGSPRRSPSFGILRFLLLVSGRAGRGLQGRVADARDAAGRAVRPESRRVDRAHRGHRLPAAAQPDTGASPSASHRALAAKPGAWVDLALTLPVFLAYQLGVVFLNVRNATDVVTARLLELRAR